MAQTKGNIGILLGLMCCLLSCSYEPDWIDQDSNDFNVNIPPTEKWFADSSSRGKVILDFSDAPLLRAESIRVFTDHGVLLAPPLLDGSTAVLPAANTLTLPSFTERRELTLIANTLDPADVVTITVSAYGHTKQTTTQFAPAFPENMLLAASTSMVPFYVPRVNIQVILDRQTGKASNGLKFDVSSTIITTPSPNPDSLTLRYACPDFVRSNQGRAIVPIQVLSHAKGFVLRVTVETEGADGELLSKDIDIRFV